MPALSRATVAKALRGIGKLSRPQIDQFFFGIDVPPENRKGYGKTELIMNAVRWIEEHQGGQFQDLVARALEIVVDDDKQVIEAHLLSDGFVAGEGALIPIAPKEREMRSGLLLLLDRVKSSVSTTTVEHHFNQAEAHFSEGEWDSSIGQMRKVVEQLLNDIAKETAKQRSETPDLRVPIRVRDYLVQSDFLGKSERTKLLDGVYGYLSEEGSHPGISTHSAARVSYSLLLSFGAYLLEKYDSWIRGGFQSFAITSEEVQP